MPFLRGSLLLLAFGLIYVIAFAFSSSGLTPEHALVGLFALFGAALLPCLGHTVDVWRQVRSREQDSNPALLAFRRDLDLLFRTQEDHAERVQLSLTRLESELSPAPSPALSDPIPAITALEETVRGHIAECAATGTSVRQSIVRLDTSVQKLTNRVEQLELNFAPAPPAPPSEISNLKSQTPASPASNSSLITQNSSLVSPASSSSPASPLLGRALASGAAPSGHVSRLISGGFRQTPEDKEVANPAPASESQV